ncbi:hypothetical protein [Ectopseudomonas oleovorans]|uniref:hypothetical protein n=1 Tax=Ectopseudomonas oleovorans TaxID=301 RepID=UPI001F14BD38|nr:hypothetical protein [Pseudomonas oleovorans]
MSDVLQRRIDPIAQCTTLAAALMFDLHPASALHCPAPLTKMGVHHHRGFP